MLKIKAIKLQRKFEMRTLFLTILTLGVLYAEFLGDYVQFFKCSWPKISASSEDELRVMILADTHILGPIRGHWLDKLYREWHMHRAFQAADFLFQPEVIFILGDLFDEGDIIDHNHFMEHVERFRRHFHTDKRVISAVGNHDIGFHYRLHPYFTERFEMQFNNTGVQLYSLKGVHFVVINSMAMKNDGCSFCEDALYDLNDISAQLACLRNRKCKDKSLLDKLGVYSEPILMQHFPTYRQSDEVCLQGDIPHIETYRENWEVLSKASTDLLGKLLKPRLAFAGHSHHFCLNKNRLGILEYTVASFNWRNKINPSFLLAKFSSTEQAVQKCDMLSQTTVFNVYVLTLIFSFICFISGCFNRQLNACISKIINLFKT